MNKIEPRVLKGFRDFGLKEQSGRQAMFNKIQTVFEQFGFLPLSTPTLEYKEILMGKYGDDEKLVYSFEDNGGRDVAMRYDLTVPLARYVAQNRGSILLPFKRYQIAPVWRADNPQKGRWREFYQCDVDVVGSDNPLSDAEVIACGAKAIEALGIVNYKIRINDREVLTSLGPDAIRSLDKVEKIGVDGMEKEMLSKGISTEQIQLAKDLVSGNRIALPARLKEVINLLEKFNLKGTIEFDPTIARGLDYYSGTVFETVLPDKPEYGSIYSGGRYDGLLSQYSDASIPAVGASVGIDRLYGALEELGLLSKGNLIDALILNLSSSFAEAYINLANMLRESGLNVELYYESTKLDKQFKYAEQKEIKWAIICGEEELKNKTVQLKNIQTREQKTVPISELGAQIT